MIDNGRLRVELRLLAAVGIAWTISAAQALLWVRIVLDPQEFSGLPWLMLALPHVVALAVTALSLYAESPPERWSTPRSASPALWIALGVLTLPFAPLFVARDRRARREAPPSEEAAERAFARLLRLPRVLGLRFWSWSAGALAIDAVVLGQASSWGTLVLGLFALWLCTLTPLAVVVTGASRAVVRPQILTAPHRLRTFPDRAVLRQRLTTQAAVVSTALVLAPLCAAALLHLRTFDDVTGPWAALAFSGFVFAAGGLASGVFVARSVHRDVVRVTARTAAVVRGASIPKASEGSYATAEARALVAAIDRMVHRISESNVAHYVAIEKAKEADRLKSQFLANMSHDLRSPLNAILGFSELLLSGIDGELTEGQREMLAVILSSGRDLLREIDDILDTAKIDAGRLELNPEPTPVANVVTRAIAAAKKRTPSLPTFSVKVAPGLPSVLCDTQRTVQAIANVLLFAHEGTDSPEVGIDVKLGSTERGAVVFVDVTVQHHPASSDDLARARAGFFRIPGHRGLGLGLPIAASVLEQQGGALDIEELESAMVFSLELPAAVRSTRRSRTIPAMPRRRP